jgi:predicted DNA-binding transcriptional regulator YafY
MADTAMRYLAMLRLLPAKPRKATATELRSRLAAQGYNVDLRSIQRDLQKLSAEYAIESDGAKPAGWLWSKDAEKVFMPGMDLSTALTYELLERYLSPMLPRSILRNLAPYFKQAKGVLTAMRGDPVGRWARKIAVITPGQQLIPPVVDPTVSEVVYEALLRGKRFEVEYRNLGASGHKKLVVNPLGLVYRQGVLYVVATTWNYDDLRQLVMHRMRSAIPLEQDCTEPANFDLDKYIREAKSFEYPAGRVIKLQLIVEPWLARHLEECRLSEHQSIRALSNSDRFRVTADVPETEQLYWWLAGLGANVEVRGPKSARRIMTDLAQKVVSMYST